LVYPIIARVKHLNFALSEDAKGQETVAINA